MIKTLIVRAVVPAASLMTLVTIVGAGVKF